METLWKARAYAKLVSLVAIAKVTYFFSRKSYQKIYSDTYLLFSKDFGQHNNNNFSNVSFF